MLPPPSEPALTNANALHVRNSNEFKLDLLGDDQSEKVTSDAGLDPTLECCAEHIPCADCWQGLCRTNRERADAGSDQRRRARRRAARVVRRVMWVPRRACAWQQGLCTADGLPKTCTGADTRQLHLSYAKSSLRGSPLPCPPCSLTARAVNITRAADAAGSPCRS